MSANSTIYTGHVWREYDSNKLILTLQGPAAGALTAAIPLFIAVVGPMSWILIKYPWYQISIRRQQNSASSPSWYYKLLRRQRRTRFYPLYTQQRNVLLRNSAGDLGTVAEVFNLFTSWSKPSYVRPLQKSCLLFSVSFLFWAAWQVAGIVSFYIWQNTVPPVALTRSSSCGYNLMSGPDAELPFRRIGLSQTIIAETYVSQCYGSSPSNSGACGIYASTSINFTTNDTECPFSTPDICINTNSTPFQLDSGPIDSQNDLGINSVPSDRVTYRKVTTCSPVHSTRFAQIIWANETKEKDLWPSDTRLQQFYYGPVTGANVTWTFEYSEWAPSDGFGYDITGITYNPGSPGDDLLQAWMPNTTFSNRTDADVSVLFLTQNHIVYNASVYDPFFLTDANYTETVNGERLRLFTPAFYVNVMGCIDQHQICNPNQADNCTPLRAYNQLPAAIGNLNFNPFQVASAQRIITNLVMTNTFNSVNGRRAAALLASQTVSETLQTKLLPVDQWRLEVSNWFAVSLAKLQQGIVDFATGPLDEELLPYIKYPVDPWTASLCDKQLISLPAGYTNFDFDAIIIVTVVGFSLIFLGIFYEGIMQWLLKRIGNIGALRWTMDGPYQLLKSAYEGRGLGEWEDPEGDLPITRVRDLPELSSSRHNVPNEVPLQALPSGVAESRTEAQPGDSGPSAADASSHIVTSSPEPVAGQEP